ncbi:hypothetical protein H4R33_003134 [Dimargaris cristalligena]|uniref:Uncharacterized protein n=1 Tax=Dimargaris cristalligena TaxID=215637 RepID=A0A4P9ZRC4_9FUNG|nr:hypothetical protein H4R33_003134 [Dimargaris cristalligena]RKP36076.1 hypothetical protein BJ085DRAFT_38954 [Dimargaris cristalligena]|eukprot:RKP36076.1 hypothetical protein BJ085DRAFT_38954 [Dimargaris cristalligena]
MFTRPIDPQSADLLHQALPRSGTIEPAAAVLFIATESVEPSVSASESSLFIESFLRTKHAFPFKMKCIILLIFTILAMCTLGHCVVAGTNPPASTPTVTSTPSPPPPQDGPSLNPGVGTGRGGRRSSRDHGKEREEIKKQLAELLTKLNQMNERVTSLEDRQFAAQENKAQVVTV